MTHIPRFHMRYSHINLSLNLYNIFSIYVFSITANVLLPVQDRKALPLRSPHDATEINHVIKRLRSAGQALNDPLQAKYPS